MVDYCHLLMYLANNMASDKVFRNSTRAMAKDFPLSQQSISRILIEMEKQGMIERQVGKAGVNISITTKGWNMLRNAYNTLHHVFSTVSKFNGKVVTGLGEGRYYTELPGYQKQFKEKLGFKPYPGTFNVEIDFDIRYFLSGKCHEIDSFQSENRTFGNINCYKAKVNGMECFLIFPARTHHKPNIVELIAPVFIRGELKVEDDNTVEVELL